ncbi:MAG TPA: WD40 repeat domain-containing protein [Nodularia sp. (in: cyanobacteria)]|nr:WD40 repeat domain-containing protein [Nodularia sp. (in: cyanobacteria)]
MITQAVLAYQQTQKAQLREIQALNSLSDNFLLSHKQLEALLTSLKAGREVQKITPGIPSNIQSQTATILQKAVYGTQERHRLTHNSWVSSVSFSPDGQILASASSDNTIKLWSRDGKLLANFIDHSRSINSVSFSPEGDTIASASDDGTVKLWSLDGRLLSTLPVSMREVLDVTFSPDGQTMASASADGRVKLWSREGNLLRNIQVSFSPDGKMLVSGGEDATIKVWKLEEIELQTLNLDQLLDHACDRLGDYLKTSPDITTEEYQLCFGD